MLPATPSNLGVFQAACVFVLHKGYGISVEDALGYGIILQAVEIATAFVMGAPALLKEGVSWRDVRLRAMHASPVELPPLPSRRGERRRGRRVTARAAPTALLVLSTVALGACGGKVDRQDLETKIAADVQRRTGTTSPFAAPTASSPTRAPACAARRFSRARATNIDILFTAKGKFRITQTRLQDPLGQPAPRGSDEQPGGQQQHEAGDRRSPGSSRAARAWSPAASRARR